MEKLAPKGLSWEEAREVVRKDLEGRGVAHLEAATTESPAEDYLKTLEDIVVLQMNAEAASQVLVTLQILQLKENHQ